MIRYSESLEIMNQVLTSSQLPSYLVTERMALDKAFGRVLAENVVSQENNPNFDNSAMDGFAISTSEYEKMQLNGEQWMAVQGQIAAGDLQAQNLFQNQAVEIMTGAALPNAHFDCVVRLEDVEVKQNANGSKFIRFNKNPKVNDNIRRCGEDIRAGELLLSAHSRIGLHELVVLATVGHSSVCVYRPIKCALLATGKELVDYHTPELSGGQVRNSTAMFLHHALLQFPTEVTQYGIIPDVEEHFKAKLNKILTTDVDIILTTGAVSMGAFDFVKPALQSMGAEIHFHKCSIRPGKPVLFASLNKKMKRVFIFGLPGNPVSTIVGYNFFVQPFIKKMLGMKEEEHLTGQLTSDLKKPEGLKCFYKANLFTDKNGLKVESLMGQASFMVKPLLKTNSWLILPEQEQMTQQGSQVEVVRI